MAFQLRNWQRQALADYHKQLKHGRSTVMWEATPGAGKTTAALQLCQHQLRTQKRRHAIIVVPTAHLKTQWAAAAVRFNIHLDNNFKSEWGIAPDYDGITITYQQVANQPEYYRRLSRGAVVVLDEVHHAGEGRMWGESLLTAFDTAGFVLSLSGTPFRSDSNAIPFVEYDKEGQSQPDYIYNYGRAIEDAVCRPVAFFTYGGDIAWREGEMMVETTFSDDLYGSMAARRLRAALEPSSGWIDDMLYEAHEMLTDVRQEHPGAGGLLVAADQRHARDLAQRLYEVSGHAPTVVLSDDSEASAKIEAFGESNDEWIVACNMVSEGVDIPRLRVGIYATTITTRMYFRQFLGRMVRITPQPSGGVQVAYIYLPADPRLRRLAEQIEEEQRHVIKHHNGRIRVELPPDRAAPETQGAQWDALRATNSGIDAVIVNGRQLTLFDDPGLAPPTETQSQRVKKVVQKQVADRVRPPTRAETKALLAQEIKDLVGRYQHKTGQEFAEIHAYLNRRQNVPSQARCTIEQLRQRIKILQRLL